MGKLSSEQSGRLSDIATASRDARETARIHARKLETAVVDAIDNLGASHREVAAAISVSPTRVYEIYTTAYNRPQ